MTFGYPTITAIEHGMHGFYRIDHDAYHSGLGISSTKIKKALVSYATYRQETQVDSPALAFGRAFHAALLEPELFAARYVVEPEIDGNKNSNAYKAAYAAWEATVSGKEVLSGRDAAAIEAMIVAVKEHPEWNALPASFDPEIMGITTCKDTGFTIKCKMDLFKSQIVDFKTTSGGLSPGEVVNDMVKWKYHVSAAFYQDIIAALTGERLPFVVVPVAKSAPHECEFYELSPELIEEGRKLYKAGLRRLRKWAEEPESRIAEKRKRVLYPSSRIVYSTQETLTFIEG